MILDLNTRYDRRVLNRGYSMKSAIIALAAIAAAALVFVATRNGMALSPDSYAYLEAAHWTHLFGGIPANYNWWPPLMPITLAAFTDPVNAARWLNAAYYALSTALTLCVLKTRLYGAGIAILGGVFLFSPSLYTVHRYVWSEPLFVALVAAWFAILLTDVRKRFALFVLVTALLGLQRYVGVLFIPLGVFALALYRVHWKLIAVYVVGAAIPQGLWMLRNIGLGYPATGIDRGVPYNSLSSCAQFAIGTLISWWFPLTLAFIVGVRYRVRLPSAFTVVCAYYAVGHTLFIVWSSSSTSMDPPNQRLLAPVFVPAVYLALVLGGKVCYNRGIRKAGTDARTPRPR